MICKMLMFMLDFKQVADYGVKGGLSHFTLLIIVWNYV